MKTKLELIQQLELIPLKESSISAASKEEEWNGIPLSKGRILPKSNFIHCLRMEKLRTDRSNAPLSLALLFFRENNGNGRETIEEFPTYLNRITRETDIKGWLDKNIIGILLPNTDNKGVNLWIEKLIQGNGRLEYSVIKGTYPDHIFHQLLSEEENEPDFFPLDLDAAPKPLGLQRFLKRAIDVAGSLCGLILPSPMILMIALAVKVSSPGPVIFKQMRIGLKGVRFAFYKFRSMHWSADDQIHREYVANLISGRLEKINQGDGERPFFKMKADSRVTRVGKILRKLSLDELPQLFNVLKGDMSLVGPRPPLIYEVEKYEPWHLRRILEVKPGITGLWQVSGRSTTTFNEMVRLDLRYVKNWSLWLDTKILVKTVKEVLYPRSAA
jgi:lipopolysaccharide/colanic/teichoic acid biosynthesis glycosyltransferase